MNAPEMTVEQVDEQADAWVADRFPDADHGAPFSSENMRTAYRAGFAAGLGHARKVFMEQPL